MDTRGRGIPHEGPHRPHPGFKHAYLSSYAACLSAPSGAGIRRPIVTTYPELSTTTKAKKVGAMYDTMEET